ncbi:hypothetical protein CEUSTIGMA_g13930.t1 [Chlamydomonas eustigma]|uniref:Uncharacterized protein n=1 Tax=Chlamydomonas eustigma TaxID=1157962 RepID=A0A250XU29_9CHLO|nr:hypothetical protein CEUSTIGMA_g13930.t1 [Chlamydomonas eustigma]|eukprot:GAX86523.1 hypothetical protein CEUSTIGMA_g13930.t1 [Chlamydomonas eustigma]
MCGYKSNQNFHLGKVPGQVFYSHTVERVDGIQDVHSSVASVMGFSGEEGPMEMADEYRKRLVKLRNRRAYMLRKQRQQSAEELEKVGHHQHEEATAALQATAEVTTTLEVATALTQGADSLVEESIQQGCERLERRARSESATLECTTSKHEAKIRRVVSLRSGGDGEGEAEGNDTTAISSEGDGEEDDDGGSTQTDTAAAAEIARQAWLTKRPSRRLCAPEIGRMAGCGNGPTRPKPSKQTKPTDTEGSSDDDDEEDMEAVEITYEVLNASDVAEQLAAMTPKQQLLVWKMTGFYACKNDASSIIEDAGLTVEEIEATIVELIQYEKHSDVFMTFPGNGINPDTGGNQKKHLRLDSMKAWLDSGKLGSTKKGMSASQKKVLDTLVKVEECLRAVKVPTFIIDPGVHQFTKQAVMINCKPAVVTTGDTPEQGNQDIHCDFAPSQSIRTAGPACVAAISALSELHVGIFKGSHSTCRNLAHWLAAYHGDEMSDDMQHLKNYMHLFVSSLPSKMVESRVVMQGGVSIFMDEVLLHRGLKAAVREDGEVCTAARFHQYVVPSGYEVEEHEDGVLNTYHLGRLVPPWPFSSFAKKFLK